MSDTMRGYTLAIETLGSGDEVMAMECERCGVRVAQGFLLALKTLVKTAIEHSGRCLG